MTQEDPNQEDRKDDQSSSHVLQTTHPSVDAFIDRYDNKGSTSELEREKRKYEMIRQDEIGKSSSSEFVPWYEQDVGGMEVEELEQYLAALVELKRKDLVRAGDLADMKNASMLPLGPSTYRNNLPNTFHNDPLNIQVFGDGAKFESNTMIGPTNGLDFGDGNTMNGPTSRQYFGDGAMIGSNTMNGPTNGLDFGDRIKFQNNTMNGHGVKNNESNMMNSLANGLDFNHENNTMNGHLDFGDLEWADKTKVDAYSAGRLMDFGRQYDEASKHRAQEDPNLKDRKDDQSSSHLNVQYAKLEKELEREKRKYEMIRQDKIRKSSSSEFVPWYEQDVGGMEVEELEQYLAALVELKRKALVRDGDLADMKNASMLLLGPSTYRNNLPNTFHNDPLNMQVFGDGAKFESNTMIGLTNGLEFGDGNTMNGPTSRQYFGDGAMIGSNTMNGPTNGLDFGDRIKFQNNTMNGHGVKNIESNMMNGLSNCLDFGDGNNHENNTMNGHLDFGDLGLNKINVCVCVPKTTKYAELEKELEREKSKYEMIRQDKIGKSTSSEFVPWYEQDFEGMEVEELEQYLAALVELKRKALECAGDLADMKNASMLPLGPSMYRNNLPNTFHNDPLNMQVFGDGAMIGSNTMNGPTNGLDFGYRIKFQNITMNGHGVKNIESNMMNGPANGLDSGDGNNHENNTMNGHLDFGDLVHAGDLADMKNASMLPLGPSTYRNNLPNTFHNDLLNMQVFRDGAKFESNTMIGLTNGLDFGDRIKFQNNTMNGHGVKNIESNMMNGLANGLDFGDGNNHENNTMNGYLDFGDLGLNKFY
nr:hypothetical protein [Tanacetum cinerariifolium]